MPTSPQTIFILLIIAALATMAGCGNGNGTSDDPTPTLTAVPTGTRTPSGDRLMIDGMAVLEVYDAGPESSTVYAETANSLYRGSGSDWTITKTRPNGRRIVIHPLAEEKLYRGGHTPCAAESQADDIDFTISEDSGQTWRVTGPGQNIQPLVIDASLPEVIFGASCGLWISQDLGKTWTEFEPGRFDDVSAAVINGQQLLVLDVAVDGAGTVYAIDIASPDKPALVSSILEAPDLETLDADGARIIAGGIEGIFVSVDGGATWASSRSGLEEVTVEDVASIIPEVSDEDEIPFGILSVRLDPAHDQRIFAGTTAGLYLSQDNGATWDLYTAVNPDARVTGIIFTNGGADLFVTTDDGVVVVPNP